MYTVLRINGISEQLNSILNVLEKRVPGLSPKINRQNVLICELSKNNNVEHWADVAIALDDIGSCVDEAKAGDIELLVDTRFDLKELPDGGVAIDTLSVPQMALTAMARIGTDFEATVYRVVGG